jgi:hypothetical protein
MTMANKTLHIHKCCKQQGRADCTNHINSMKKAREHPEGIVKYKMLSKFFITKLLCDLHMLDLGLLQVNVLKIYITTE